MAVNYSAYESLLRHEAVQLDRAIPRRGRNRGFVDYVDPTRLWPTTTAKTSLLTDFRLGERFVNRRDGKAYVLVQADATAWVTAAAGQPCGPVAAVLTTVANDYSLAASKIPLGVIKDGWTAALPAAGQYFWLQYAGQFNVPTLTSGTVGQAVKWTADGAVAVKAAATDVPIGTVLDATAKTILLKGG